MTGFHPDLEPLAEQLKALAHPARLAILKILAERTCVCGQIVGGLPLAQATVSQHLKVLKEAGFVRGEISGPCTCYCLDAGAFDEFRAALGRLLDDLGKTPEPVGSLEKIPEDQPT